MRHFVILNHVDAAKNLRVYYSDSSCAVSMNHRLIIAVQRTTSQKQNLVFIKLTDENGSIKSAVYACGGALT